MSNPQTALPRDTQVDINDESELERVAQLLSEALGSGFGLQDCLLSLYLANGSVDEAAEDLVGGICARGQRSVSWNWASLQSACAILVERTGLPAYPCLEKLKDCMGNVDLAERKLKGLPALP
jgi:hypothetical protein